MKPSESSSAISRQPMPLGEAITGMPVRCTRSVSSLPASDNVTPWPTNRTGCLAVRIIATATVTSSGAAPPRGRGWQLDRVLLLEHVERHVDVHRAGPARHHKARRLAQRERKHVDARGLEAALDHRSDDAREVRLVVAVYLLERAAVELRGRHIGRNRHQ